MENNTNYLNPEVMGWDSLIEDDGRGYLLLPEGDYGFEVVDFERDRFNGSAKLPACNKAVLTLAVETEEGTAHVRCDLLLCRALEWKLSSFFRSIGQKKKGERVTMDWSRVKGAHGRGHFRPKSYTDSNGSEHTVNECASFLDRD